MFKIIEYRGIKLEVHDNGDVYSVPYIDMAGRSRIRRERKQSNAGGYRQIGIYGTDKVAMPVRVHRLVAKAFLPDWDKDLSVDHINLDKADNRVDNLRMVSQRENVRLYYEEQSVLVGVGRRSRPNNGYRNVSKAKRGKFMAQMRIGGKTLSNGTSFHSEIDAACAVNDLCLKHNQPLSRFNIPLKAERVSTISPNRHYAKWYTNWDSVNPYSL